MDVRIEGLRFSRGGRSILSVDALELPAGGTTVLFGPNGSGKTTLLSLLAGLEQPDRGQIVFGGWAPRRRPPVALAFQRPVFLRGNLRWNLALGLRIAGLPEPEVKQRIARSAEHCGIGALLERPAQALSGGEAQRANLARALALQAPVTLLDEPLSGLDRLARAVLLEDLPDLLRGFTSTSVIVTHDREEAFRLADRIVVLVDGAVIAAGAPGALYRDPPSALAADLLGYTLLRLDSGVLAVPAGGIVPGRGEEGLEVLAERIADMGNHLHLVGRLAGQRVSVKLSRMDPLPSPGAAVPVRLEGAIRFGSG